MTRAHVSCESNKTPVDSHFRDTTKMVTAGVAARAVKDFKLTRYACYLIAQNGDQTSLKSRSPRRTSRCRHAGFPIPRVDSICESGCALTGSTPCKVNKKRRSTEVDRLNMLWWAVRGSACCAGGRCGAKAPCALRWQTLTRFLSSAPFRVRPHVRSTKKATSRSQSL